MALIQNGFTNIHKLYSYFVLSEDGTNIMNPTYFLDKSESKQTCEYSPYPTTDGLDTRCRPWYD